MKKYDVCGLGNALVDLLFECSDQEFSALKVAKGGMSLIDAGRQKEILKLLKEPVGMSSGGSVSNSMALVGQLGGRAALMCSIANDSHGKFFVSDLAKLGVEVEVTTQNSSDIATGTSLVVVTPDAERTMSTSLGASAEIDVSHINQSFIDEARYVFIEGYLIANSEQSRDVIRKTVEIAKKSQTKVAVTLSDAFVVNGFADFITELLPQTDLIFANEIEAAALVSETNPESAFEKLRAKYPGVVVTAGAKGAYFSIDGNVGHCDAYACKPLDLTGAGDAFAGAFLSGLCSDLSAFESAKKGCFYASKVIQQWGARIRADMRKLHAEFAGS